MTVWIGSCKWTGSNIYCSGTEDWNIATSTTVASTTTKQVPSWEIGMMRWGKGRGMGMWMMGWDLWRHMSEDAKTAIKNNDYNAFVAALEADKPTDVKEDGKTWTAPTQEEFTR